MLSSSYHHTRSIFIFQIFYLVFHVSFVIFQLFLRFSHVSSLIPVSENLSDLYCWTKLTLTVLFPKTNAFILEILTEIFDALFKERRLLAFHFERDFVGGLKVFE